MTSKIQLLGISIAALLFILPAANAWCSGEKCTSDCLQQGKTHKSCLMSCCAYNSDTFGSLNQCHSTCRVECIIEEDRYSEDLCYSGCLNACAGDAKKGSNNNETVDDTTKTTAAVALVAEG